VSCGHVPADGLVVYPADRCGAEKLCNRPPEASQGLESTRCQAFAQGAITVQLGEVDHVDYSSPGGSFAGRRRRGFDECSAPASFDRSFSAISRARGATVLDSGDGEPIVPTI
jgi:hypothetical protein